MKLFEKEFDAAIFDMDGTMFDTERLRFKVLKQASLELYGEEMSDDLLYDSLGVSAVTGEALAKERYGEEFPYKEIRKLADDLERQYVRENGVPVKDGLYNLLERLKKNQVLIAIATSSRKEIVMEYLIRAKVLRYFDIMVCGDEVEKGKPDPEIFLRAAGELSCDPERCLIIEDSYNGLKAAVGAGGIPIFIKDIKEMPEDILEKVHCKYEKMQDFLNDIVDITKKMPIPDLYDHFPLNEENDVVGIHGFGAIGGGYMAQIFSHWDGYTRPKEIIGATHDEFVMQIVNALGKYRVNYESIAYFQTISRINVIDIMDPDAVIDMYKRSVLIGLCLPEKVIPLQADTIARGLVERYEGGGTDLSILIVMNKVSGRRYVMKNIEKALKNIVGDNKAKEYMNRTCFSMSVVNRMVSVVPKESIAAKLKNDLDILFSNIKEYSEEITNMIEISNDYQTEVKNTKKKKKVKTISVSQNLTAVSQFARDMSEMNVTLFSSEPDMPIYVSNHSPVVNKLRQVVVIDDIGAMQEIKNKLSNGTHAIIAWYSKILGYETIGQGMGDPRVEKLAKEIMKYEISPALLKDNPTMKNYISGFIHNFILRCRSSFKDKCIRVGRDPLRKLQNGERVIGAIQLASKFGINTKRLEFGVACGLVYALKLEGIKDVEADIMKSVYEKNNSIEDVLTYDGPYNKGNYNGLNREKDKEMIERITEHFNELIKII